MKFKPITVFSGSPSIFLNNLNSVDPR